MLYLTLFLLAVPAAFAVRQCDEGGLAIRCTKETLSLNGDAYFHIAVAKSFTEFADTARRNADYHVQVAPILVLTDTNVANVWLSVALSHEGRDCTDRGSQLH